LPGDYKVPERCEQLEGKLQQATKDRITGM
jgi:hypothetical protein